MALVKERESMIDQLRSLVGELGLVTEDANSMLGRIPTKASMYKSYQEAGTAIEMEDMYKATLVEGGYWQLYIKRGGQWIKT